jgi:hypothetical protein
VSPNISTHVPSVFSSVCMALDMKHISHRTALPQNCHKPVVAN